MAGPLCGHCAEHTCSGLACIDEGWLVGAHPCAADPEGAAVQMLLAAATSTVHCRECRGPPTCSTRPAAHRLPLRHLHLGKAQPQPGDPGAAVQMDESEQLLRYACSPRVLPLMTTRLNAQRCARLVQQPIVASVSDSVWNFASNSQGYVHQFRRFTVCSCLQAVDCRLAAGDTSAYLHVNRGKLNSTSLQPRNHCICHLGLLSGRTPLIPASIQLNLVT